jgi:Ca-activated chloride channel family protein
VLPKQEATEQYEDAIADGDTPVMVTASAKGLYTANLGNLRPGDEAVIEITYAQALAFEQGHLRLTVPTVIAPRYGDAHGPGGLAVHETAAADLQAEYPFTLQLTLQGPVAGGQMACPSHRIHTQVQAGQTTITLDRGAWLDRDFVLNIDGLQGRSFTVQAPDGEQTMAMASFCPQWPATEPRPLLLKLLVDCSGSMAGDSIAQARAALQAVIRQLHERDHVSYTRFGSTVHHVIPRLDPCTEFRTAELLPRIVMTTEADLGGTEMAQALQETLAIRRPRGHEGTADVLLITDGEVWQIDDIIDLAQSSGQRIFAVGVGSAPAESLLRTLAERSGGACEFVTPNEDMGEAVLRMFHRMRQGQPVDIQVDWGQPTKWQSPLPRLLVPGETVHTFALLDTPLRHPPRLQWQAVNVPSLQTLEGSHLQTDPSGTVTRLGGAMRLAQTSDTAEAQTLALHYQLVSQHTHLILVHQRAEDDKTNGLPQLQKIAQMQAAGWGGLGSVQPQASRVMFSIARMGSDNMPFIPQLSRRIETVEIQEMQATAVPSVWRQRNRSSAAAKVDSLASGGMDDFEIPAFLRKQAEDILLGSPNELLTAANTLAAQGTAWDALCNSLSLDIQNAKHPLALVMAGLLQLVGQRSLAWACLLQWLAELAQTRPADTAPKLHELDRHAQRMVRHALQPLEPATLADSLAFLNRALPHTSATSWGASGLGLLEKTSIKARKPLSRSAK